jgi:hypothetical protein
MSVGAVSRGVAVPNECLRALAIRAGLLSEFADQAKELVVIEGKKVGKLESHSTILS